MSKMSKKKKKCSVKKIERRGIYIVVVGEKFSTFCHLYGKP